MSDTKDTGLYGMLRQEGQPNHSFDENGRCIRCNGDAESWDAGCIEEIFEQLQAEVKRLTEERGALENLVLTQQVVLAAKDDALRKIERRAISASGHLLVGPFARELRDLARTALEATQKEETSTGGRA